MKKEFIIAQIGRILIIIAILLTVLNTFYWNNTLVDALAIILAAVSLIIVIFISRTYVSNLTSGALVLNDTMIRVQLLNMVYKSVIEYNFESLPLKVEEEVKDKIPTISTEDLLKTYNYILKIPKELNIYLYKEVLPNNRKALDTEKSAKNKIENKYPWMDEESLELTYNYFLEK